MGGGHINSPEGEPVGAVERIDPGGEFGFLESANARRSTSALSVFWKVGRISLSARVYLSRSSVKMVCGPSQSKF